MSEKTEKKPRRADRRLGDRRQSAAKFKGEDQRKSPRREEADRRRA